MKNILIIVVLLLLSGCSTLNSFLVAKYDTNEYELINWIRTTAELSVETCDNNDVSKQNFVTLYRGSLEFKNFTQYLRRNADTHELSKDLYQLIDQGVELYATNDQVSQTFCELSLEQIIASAETIQQVLGDKPR
jgi:uncharacterized membrane protein